MRSKLAVGNTVTVRGTSREQEWRPPIRGRLPLNWCVVWWVDTSRGEKRFTLGRRDAAQAWKLFWPLRGKPWVIRGPELWRGRKRVL